MRGINIPGIFRADGFCSRLPQSYVHGWLKSLESCEWYVCRLSTERYMLSKEECYMSSCVVYCSGFFLLVEEINKSTVSNRAFQRMNRRTSCIFTVPFIYFVS